MLQNQLPGKASDTRARRSTSAIMRNMTKPRYASMATLRATGGGLGTGRCAGGEDARTEDSTTADKLHLPRRFGLDIIISVPSRSQGYGILAHIPIHIRLVRTNVMVGLRIGQSMG